MGGKERRYLASIAIVSQYTWINHQYQNRGSNVVLNQLIPVRTHVSEPVLNNTLAHLPRATELNICMWTVRVRFTAVQEFPLLHDVQTGSGAYTASYPMGTGGSFPGGKATGAWTSAEVKKGEAIPPLCHMSSWNNDK
jgi:hypothetical protein